MSKADEVRGQDPSGTTVRPSSPPLRIRFVVIDLPGDHVLLSIPSLSLRALPNASLPPSSSASSPSSSSAATVVCIELVGGGVFVARRRVRLVSKGDPSEGVRMTKS